MSRAGDTDGGGEIRYRVRKVGSEEKWSDDFSLHELMAVVRRHQKDQGGPFRLRRRSRKWRRWTGNGWLFRVHLRFRLRMSDLAVWQFQVGGPGGPVFGAIKFELPPPDLVIGEKVVTAAKRQMGVPYDFGEANGPEDPGADEFDCSGLTQWAWATVGVGIDHNAEAQRTGSNVAGFSDQAQAQPGDLVFMWFENDRNIPDTHASHVGIWLKLDTVVDTRSPRSPVAVRPIEGKLIGFGRPH
jgi:cell wall-associated NlpC family hydrolase